MLMMSQCRACKYCIVYKAEFELDPGDFGCKALINPGDIDFYSNCGLFEPIERKDDYVESDMACDVCIFNKKCNLINVTNIWDEFSHYYDVEDNYCYSDNGDFEDLEYDDD